MADPPPAQEAGEEQQAPTDQAANHHISDLLEEERQQDSTLPSEENGLAHTYKRLAEEEQEAASDNGSVDALPRRAGSPVDSMMSIPDRSPSVQVAHPAPLACSHQELTLPGLWYFLSQQQRPPIARLEAPTGEPDPVLPTLRPPLPVPHRFT